MSCQLKHINPEKYGPPPRSDYDKKMLELYNSDNSTSYYTIVYPSEKNNKPNQKLCSKCNFRNKKK